MPSEPPWGKRGRMFPPPGVAAYYTIGSCLCLIHSPDKADLWNEGNVEFFSIKLKKNEIKDNGVFEL